jgi:hypothetical protein
MSSLPLNEYIFKVNKPCVFKNMLTRVGEQNSACEWNFEKLASLLKNQTLTFRIGNKHASRIKLKQIFVSKVNNQARIFFKTIKIFNSRMNASMLRPLLRNLWTGNKDRIRRRARKSLK